MASHWPATRSRTEIQMFPQGTRTRSTLSFDPPPFAFHLQTTSLFAADFNPLPQISSTNRKLPLLLPPRERVLINEHIRVAHVANRNREYSPEFLWPISPITTTSTLLAVVKPLSLYVSLPLRPSRSEALEIYIRTSRPIFSRLVSRSSGT